MKNSLTRRSGCDMKRYEQFPHTADIGIRAYGKTLKELFANAAFAMFDVIADLEGLKTSVTQSLELKAANYEELLIAFLDELLYNFYTKSLIFSKFDIEELTENSIYNINVPDRQLACAPVRR